MVRPIALVLSLASVTGCFVDPGAGQATAGPVTTGGATTGGATTGGATTGDDDSTSVAPTTGTETGAGTTGADASTETTGTGEPALPGCGLVKDDELLACYRFESLAGDEEVLDESLWANHAKANGAALAQGIAGSGLDVSANSKVQAPSGPHLAPGQAMTWAAWVRPRTLPQGEARTFVVDKPSQFAIMVRAVGAVCGSTGFQTTTTAPLAVGVWTHLACVHAADNSLTLYRDGVAMMPQEGLPIGPDFQTALIIGNDGPTPTIDTAFDGTIDELKIWGRALTAEEVARDAGRSP